MLSGIGPSGELRKHHIPSVLDLPGVGDNLIDHPVVDLYFKTNESWVPIMHRPTVDRDLASRRYLRDRSYGYLVLTMCALASRHTDDPRVFADRRPGSENSAGWQWWSQVEIIRRSYRSAPSLYELQTCALGVLFLWGTSVPEDCWKSAYPPP